ncbi:uncharacterized protein abca12 isoform X2 [Alosa sapidissima]|uniref:uncharacterized protein abca12 isoform X2 n=1 Tax=Alosa sapidissima TaxID=34773 RepID=UPI001C0936F7|nr:uncharacterized protein abca12 isoform X2 [Alosa sapidissima]
MAFFHQLRLLLWKNGLSVIRQPGWSLALLIWPLVIFIILAITRSQFPPKIKDTCYVAPRNLPSAGFFPFLQTLMCNTDTSCSNHSRLVGRHFHRSHHGPRVARDTRDEEDFDGMGLLPAQPPIMAHLKPGGLVRNARSPQDLDNQTDIMELWDMLLNSSQKETPSKTSLMAALNNTMFLDKAALHTMLQSVDQLKQSFCKLSLSTIDPLVEENNPFVLGLMTFCKTNDTFLEVSLIILNKVLTQLIMDNPAEVLNTLGVAVAVFENLQKQDSLWELLLDLPNLFLLPTDEEKLAASAKRLEYLKSSLTSIQSHFPEANLSVAMVNPVIEGGMSLLKYMSTWSGKDVYVSLRDLMMPFNMSLVSPEFNQLVEQVSVPLSKAAALLDRASFRGYVCGNSSAPSWIEQACTDGQVDRVFDWISPQKVAEQVLLAWSDNSAPTDVEFAKQFLNGLFNGFLTPGLESSDGRSQRSSLGQPQNVQEELFVSIGSVVLDLLQGLPGWETVHSILMGGHTSMQLVTQAMMTQQELMSLVMKDAQNIQATLQALMQNQSVADIWATSIMDSAVKSAMQAVLAEGPVECSSLAAQWSWLSSLSSLDSELWETLLCPGNGSYLEKVLMAPLYPVIQKVNQLVGVVEGSEKYNVSASMILAEWHSLSLTASQYGELFEHFLSELDQDFLDSLIPTNVTVNWQEVLIQSGLKTLEHVGPQLQTTALWGTMEPYLHLAYYIMTYQPNITAPPNCTLVEMMPYCDTGFTLDKFIITTGYVVEEFSTNPAALLRYVQGSVALVQSIYRDFYIKAVTKLLSAPGQLPGDGSIGYLLENLIHVLDKDLQLLSNLMSIDQFASRLPMSLLRHIVDVLGLEPLEAIWGGTNDTTSIINAILEVAKNNQNLFSGLPMNQTNQSVAELEAVILKWLEMQVNLTLPISFNLSEALLTYSASLNATDLAYLEQVLKPLTNQTSGGLAEFALRALVLLKEVVDASDGSDPSAVLLGYVRQLQDFLGKALQLEQHVQLLQPGGGLNLAQITNLRPVVMDLLQTLSSESLEGPAVVEAILRQLGVVLPEEFQAHYHRLVNDTRALIADLNVCLATGQDCAAGVSQVSQILYQVSEKMLAGAGGNVILQFGPLQGNLSLSVTGKLLALLRPWTNVSSSQELTMETVAQVLYFLEEITSMPNISVAALQQILSSSNLTIYELDKIAQLTMNTSVPIILSNLTAIANIQQCFYAPHNTSFMGSMNSSEIECALQIIHKAVDFLQTFPLPQQTKSDLVALKLMTEVFAQQTGKDPIKLTEEILRMTLENIKESLRNLNHSNTEEIINELNILEGILQLGFHEQYPMDTRNETLLENQVYAQKVYAEIAQWYLKKLENATSDSMFANILFSIFRTTQMQLAITVAQSDFSALLVQQVEGVFSQVQLPLDEYDLRRIGHSIITILRGQLELVKINLKLQQDYYDSMGMPMNISIPRDIEVQIMTYINLTQSWISDPSFTSALAGLLQWDMDTVNMTTVHTDITHLIKAIIPLLSAEEQAFFTVIDKVFQALIHAVEVATFEGPQSANFTEATLKAVRVILEAVPTENGTLPSPVIHQIVEALGSSLQLILHPNMSYAESNHLSLVLARSVEDLIRSLIPGMAAEVLLPMTNVVTTYFETISQPAGPDQWNIIIVNIMKGLAHSLPQNSTAQPYLSLITRVTQFILNATDGSPMDILESLGTLNITDIEEVAEQLGGVLGSLLPLLGDQVQGLTPHSAKVFADALPVLMQIITGQADQHTFERLERIVAVLLTIIRGTPAWNEVPSTLHVFSMMADNLNAQAEFIHSVQEPLLNLTTNLLQAVNTSNFDMADFFREFQLALQHTIEVAIQTAEEGRALNCSDVLKMWEEAGEAAGVPPSSLSMWCHISLAPFIEASNLSGYFPPFNTTGAGPEAQSVNATAAKIVQVLGSLYNASLSQTYASQQLITVLIDHISASLPGITAGSPDYWNEQLFNLQLYQSFSGLDMALDQVELVAPWMRPYIQAVEKAVEYTLRNSQRLMNTTSGQQVFMEALEILLTGMNVTRSPMDILEGLGTLNFTDIEDVAEQLGGVLGSLFPLLGDQAQGLTPHSAKVFADTLPVLMQIITGQADQHTFERLERIVAVLLTTIRGTPAWNEVPSTLHVFSMMADNLNAQAEFIHSVQEPLLNLTTNLLQAVNTSNFDMADFFREFQLALQHTIEVAIQTAEEGRALNCSDVLKMWEEAGEAAGVPPSSLSMWCHISLAPFIEASNLSGYFPPFNTTGAGPEAQSVNATAAKIVQVLGSLYNASLSQTYASQQLITVLIDHISASLPGITAGSPDYWNEQLFNLQLYQSFSGLDMALDQVELVAPWMRPYIQAVEKAVEYTLRNSQRLMNTTSGQQVFMEALEILLTGMNVTRSPMDILEGLGTLNFTDIEDVAEQLGGVLGSLLPLLGDQVQGLTPHYADALSVLMQIITGQADQQTFERLERIVAVLLTTIRGTPAWNEVPSTLHVFSMMADYLNAQAEFIHSVQEPLLNLTTNLLQAVNTSTFDMADFFREFQLALQHTIEVAIQTAEEGRALNCSDVLKMWEEAGEAAGVPPSSLSMWCHISLAPFIEASNLSGYFPPFNTTGAGPEAQSVNATAAKIVQVLESLYDASLSQTYASQQLITVLIDHISASLPAGSPDYWNEQLFNLQLYQSFSGLDMALDQVELVAPWMRPYIQAVEKAVEYTLRNSQRLMNTTSGQQVFMEALEILLTGMNVTSESIHLLLSGDINNIDGPSIDRLLKFVIKEVIQMKLLGDWPMAYSALEQILASSSSSVVLARAIELVNWFGTTQETGMGFLTEALRKIYHVVQAVLKMVSHFTSDLPGSDLFTDIVGNALNMLRQITSTSDFFAPLDGLLEELQRNLMSVGQAPSRRTRREAMRGPMDDFLDLLEIDYNALFEALAIPPTPEEIIETVHVFFSNPDLAIFLKGVTRDMTGSSAHDETIDTALNVLSHLMLPSQTMNFVELFMEIAEDGWSVEDLGKLEKLAESLARTVDMAMILSRQPSLNIAQRIEQMAQQLSGVVDHLISRKENITDIASEFLTALNNILLQNIEEAKDISPQITAILKDIIATASNPGSQTSLLPYLMALDQTVRAFAPVLSTENLMYFNTSGQMIKAFAMLISYPHDVEKVLQSADIISGSLNHVFAYSGEVSLPGGHSIQEVVYPVVLSSAVASHILWNLSTVSHTFTSDQETQMMVIQGIEQTLALLPEDMQMYTAALRPALLSALLSALSGVSSTNQIRPAFFNISQEVTASLLTILNITEGPVSMNAHGPAHVLAVVSNQVSLSVFEGLLMASSSSDLTLALTSLRRVVITLSTVMPAEGSHYLNVSLIFLENVAWAVNYTSSTGDLEGAMSIVSDFAHTLQTMVQYSVAETTGNVLGDLEATLQKALQTLLSGSDPLTQSAELSKQILHSIHGLLSLADSSIETNLARQVLGVTTMNVGHLFMMNSTNWVDELPMVLADIAKSLPDGLPYTGLIKNITIILTNETEDNLNLLLHTVQTASELLMTDMWNANYSLMLRRFASQLCALERMEAVQQLTQTLSLPSGLLCQSVAPAMQALHEIITNMTQDGADLYNVLFELFVGDPATYNLETDWTNVVSQVIGFNVSSFAPLEINMTAPQVKVAELFQNVTAFAVDVRKYTQISPEIIEALLNLTLPSSNLQILALLTNLRHCSDPSMLQLNTTYTLLFKTFCSLRADQWYNFVVLFVRHASVENLVYKMLLSSDMQGLVRVMIQMVHFLMDMMNKLLPAIHTLQEYLMTFGNLNLVADSEFHGLVRGKRSTISSKSTFTTISRALCRNGIMALFGISKLPIMTETDPSTRSDHSRDELIDKFKIPRDASPFCMNFYLDMVNTTGGAVAWAFLKPMLLGQVLYTPDTPLTREIIRKSNGTLHQFGQLRTYSEEWIQSSSYVMQSAKLLNQTLPLLQNSLRNPFVQNFIEAQTNINVGQMKDTLLNFSNMTELLEKNKFIVTQITTLSSLMMNLSSCVNFDRYKPMSNEEEMDKQAEALTQSRDLYASIIFKLPEDKSSTLPPKVDYTIRMQIDNSMRTDRARNPFWVRENYISMTRTQRYNRGFIYLQEAIDRAIIESQLGQPVQDPAVQLQAFPYPCFAKDEYLESISFAFPLVLMIAWVLFIANFVKKLVHERELRLHEYMKMMGVNPISHFFAWFIESAVFLLVTIVILTIILKAGKVLPNSDPFLLFLYLCDYGFSILAISFLVSTFFNKTNIAGLSGSLIYIICFFPFIVVMSMERNLSFATKNILSLFSPTCFSYASQYISRYEAQEEGIQWSNAYVSPIAGDTSSFGWLCWLLLIDSLVYFIIGAYIRMVFPGKYGIPAPWYFPVMPSFWADLCGCQTTSTKSGKGLLFSNVMQKNSANSKKKGNGLFPTHEDSEFPAMPVGVALHGLTKTYGKRNAIQNLNLSFYEGHVTTLLGHNGAGKTTTMSLLTGLFGPTSGMIEVYGRDMQTNIEEIRQDLGVCMQYDVHFDHLTAKEHLLLYGQIKAPHWSKAELKEQVRRILKETGMYAHRHKRVGTLSGGMKRKLSISIAFIGGSRLVVMDEPTTGVDPCSRRSIWDIILQYKTDRTIILSTHHLDEAEVLSDRIAFMERGGLKCCGSPFYLKDKFAKGYNLTLTKKVQTPDSEERFDGEELKAFIQSYLPEARMKEGEVGDVVYCLPPYSSQNAVAFRSLLTGLDQNLDSLQLGCYGISDTTLEEVFLQLTKDETEAVERPWSVSESVLDMAASRDSLPDDLSESSFNFGDKTSLTGRSTVRGLALFWQQVVAMLLKRVHRSRRDWKGMFAQVVLPVLFVIAAMGLGSIKSDLQHFPEMELSPGLYRTGEQHTFFSNQNPDSSYLVDSMMTFPGIDNMCANNPDDMSCASGSKDGPFTWTSSGNLSKPFEACKCANSKQVCQHDNYNPPHIRNPSSQIVYNLTGLNVENYLLATANDFIRNRYGGWSFGNPLPPDLKMDLYDVPKNRTLTKVWYNPEGHHTMPAYLNSLNNFILRSRLPADKDHQQYSISVSSHPYPGQVEEEDAMVKGLVNTLVALCVLTGFSIMTASFVVYEVQEHHSGSKRLQHISGISEPFYWTINFLYDMALYLVPVAFSVAMIAAFQLPAFTERQNLGAVTLLLVLFGFATFPWMYLLTAIFKDAEMAFISYVCINLFVSVNTIISTSILYFLGQLNESDESIQAVYHTLSHVFLIFPQFSFGNGLMELARVDLQVQILKAYGVDAYKDPYSADMLGWMFLSLVLQGLLAFTLRLLMNKWLMRKIRSFFCRGKVEPQKGTWDEDEDVVAEHRRVYSGEADTDVLQLSQLSKIYQHLSKKVQAVKRLSVGIPAGECFGLLGVNGAGKTTTFKMLTGDVSPTNGTAQIRDQEGRMVDIMDCRKEGINIGYCPQVDALDDLLTGEEHLYFYARIRGISKREMHRVVNYLLRKLELGYHRNTTSENYSCGTRRKLSTALALVGSPQILLLDEPSSGMDPRSKRHLWKIISEQVKGKCAVVLTSHSMEECEALCTRLAIMVQGQFRCLGSLQHIKNRFGSGFTVKMYLEMASCNVDTITNYMQEHFPSTYLKDHHSTMVEYHVPIAPGGIADIFDQLESNKTALQIKHFSVSQTTLDEVFINFAMGKVGVETVHSEGSDSDSLDSFDAVDI